MRSRASSQRQCTCSAIFRSQYAFQRHLHDHVELQRAHERMIADLQAEVLKHTAHAEAEEDFETPSESGSPKPCERGGESGSESEIEITDSTSRPGYRGPPKTLRCPSCPSNKSFQTMPKLRRHHEQDTECHEVCVFCHKLFKRVRSFKRHAETCTGDNKRKKAYMKGMCEELETRSNIKLEKAFRKKEKRSRDEPGTVRGPMESISQHARVPKRLKITNQSTRNFSNIHGMLSTNAPPAINSHPMAPREAAAAPANLYHPIQEQSLPPDTIQTVFSSLDDIQFDAPVVRIMNGPPHNEYTWPVME